jgi:hypothetical protein
VIGYGRFQMKWKFAGEVSGRYENPSTDIAGSVIGHLERLKGKFVRVTIEEAVSECCEKWRGYLHPGGGIPMLRVNEPGRYSDLVGPVIYCPTCQKKL